MTKDATAEEIEDLRAYLRGLPAELRDGAYGEVYRARLADLEARLKARDDG